jgi:hypothetical protein
VGIVCRVKMKAQQHHQEEGIHKKNMVGIDNTLRVPEFKGVGLEDPEHHLFVYEIVWVAKSIQDDVVKIA